MKNIKDVAGICGQTLTDFIWVSRQEPELCVLPDDHEWHRSQSGTQWRRVTEVECPVCGETFTQNLSSANGGSEAKMEKVGNLKITLDIEYDGDAPDPAVVMAIVAATIREEANGWKITRIHVNNEGEAK